MADIQPIQSLDGSQPAAAGAPRVPPGGFSPTPTPTMTTNVTAPLDVSAGPGQTAFLAAQLRQSLDTLRRPLMYAEEAQGMAEATKSLQQGEADAMAGKVDTATAQANGNYNAGVVRVTAQRAALNATTAWQQWVADPKNNVSAMNPQQLLTAHDKFMRQQLGGLEGDPVAAQAMEPILTHSANETVGRFIQYKTQENFETGVTNAVQLAQAQSVHGGAAFQYGQQLDTLTALAHGNRSYAKGELDSALVQAAVANHNPALLDMIQAAPGQALSPKTQLMVSEARGSIARANKEALAQYTQSQSFGVLAGYDRMLAEKTPIPGSQITADLKANRITQSQALSYYEKSLKLGEQLDRQAGASQILAAGTPWWDHVGTQQPGSTKVYTKQDFVDANDAAIAKLPPEQRDMAAIVRTRQYGLVYSPLAARVSSEPVTTSDGVKDVLGAYNSMNSVDASITGQYFSDPKRLAEVHQMLTLRQSGMSDGDIAEYMQKHGGAQSPEALGAKAADINKALGTATFQSGTLGFGEVDMANIANPGQVQQRALTLAHQMAASGACTGATCASAATKAVIDQSYVIKLSGNHSLVIPRAVTDPPVSQSQPALQYWYDNVVPGIAKATGHDAADLRLIPNPSQPGSYTLTDSTGLPVTEQAFTLPAIVSYWQEKRGDKVRAQQQTAAARAVANTAANRTKRDMFQVLD